MNFRTMTYGVVLSLSVYSWGCSKKGGGEDGSESTSQGTSGGASGQVSSQSGAGTESTSGQAMQEILSGQNEASCTVPSSSFDGISEITEVTGTSVLINWQDTGASKYAVLDMSSGNASLVAMAEGSSYRVLGLSLSTAYTFRVRALDDDGNLDSNTKDVSVTTDDSPAYFKSCQAILDAGHSNGDGLYTIDLDDEAGPIAPLEVECDMTSHGGGWTKIFYHDSATGGFFADKTDAGLKNADDQSAALYSLANYISYFQDGSGFYTFWLDYPSNGVKNIFKQTSDPSQTSVAGYEAIDVDATGNSWGGLEKSTYASTLIDGSVNTSAWWYSIGSNASYGGGIPGYNSAVITEVVLYIR